MESPERPWHTLPAVPPTRTAVYLLALGAAALSLALLDGRLHHDEVHQYAEPAHRMVWGYGTVAHEWHRGMRNTLGPGALAGLFALARALRLDGPWALFALRHGAVTLLSLAGLRAAMDHARARTDREDLARYAGLGVALSLPWAALASRPLGETLSVCAALFALRAQDQRRWTLLGALAGLTFALRYPAGLLAAGLALPALARPRRAARFALGLGLVLAVLAALDLRAWGSPFASVTAYLRFNLLHDRARVEYGARPWWFYLACAAAFAPWPMALGLKGIRRFRPALPALAPLGLYLAVMSLVAHKEPRFFLTVIPLVAVALACASEGIARRAGWALALLVAQGAAVTLAWWHLGSFQGDIARATRAAAAREDLGSLWVINASHPGWVNLRREVPLRADPRERLAVALAGLAGAAPPPQGRAYAICDGRLREGERDRCVNALKTIGFNEVSRHGRAALMVRERSP